MNNQTPTIPFTGYQKFVVFLLAITQFTVVLDFMVMSPLGDIMMKTLSISPSQFGVAVSAYAFSAGISGLLTAGFADRFDRKKLLLFFYIGFATGTLFCALAPTFPLLVIARIVTGIFGGVIGSISMAIVADLFSLQQRGKVMGFVQMGFGASQVLGIPIGLYIANKWGWHIPFLWIAVMAGIIALTLFLKLKPINEHLSLQRDKTAFQHLLHTIAKKNYRIGFLSTALLSIGGFMMMPFGSAFAINNLKVTQEQLPLIFLVSGIATLISMPFIGKWSDKISKFKLFAAATSCAIIIINIYAHFSATPFWLVLTMNVLMMVAIMSRMVPSIALTSAIPQAQDRGAFMSINASLQQMAGGFGAMLAGVIIVQKDNFTPLQHYDTLAMIASTIMLFTIYMVYRVNKLVLKK
ncbi:MFS transporter [Flavobacterium sp. UBA4197]|uniref:MFS transporter n=1 Tax=Flavobacterium sp. UBA4197 TaxID=1946546 RepID=UPI00257A855B|nr:MFS transporter [Flavobacterium sp. UBA4197]